MIYQIITLVILAVLAAGGFFGIQKSGNYQSVWGVMFFYSTMALIVMVLGTAIVSIFS